MARTKRGIPYKHYWGQTKKELRSWIDNYPHYSSEYIRRMERDYLLHGTESRNYSVPSHEYFNRVNRVGRRIERDTLRPHIVLGENYEFDDSHYRRKYKGVWWDMY
jgi:hypothetical protein